jgi:hypothetical protein
MVPLVTEAKAGTDSGIEETPARVAGERRESGFEAQDDPLQVSADAVWRIGGTVDDLQSGSSNSNRSCESSPVLGASRPPFGRSRMMPRSVDLFLWSSIVTANSRSPLWSIGREKLNDWLIV